MRPIAGRAVAPIVGATPLAVLDAVVIDTETTGLDTTRARLVQIAAVPLRVGRVEEAGAFLSLIDPGEPIPPSATAIHGITNAMVRNAAAPGVALAGFDAFVEGRLLIGHSIGFDLAVLEREHARAGLPWRKPRTLCLRLLGAIANPRLPEQSLDALAAWLGVAIERRHSADGDAVAAARTFLALVPHLAERRIRTLAEAERACLALTEHLENAHRAGWAEAVSRPELAATTRDADPYAYRHRVRELMSAPVAVLGESTSAGEAIRHMVERGISSVFVAALPVAGGPIGDYGIVTERDVMRLLAKDGTAALDAPLGSFASRPLASIAGGAFAYRAIGRMDRLKLRHLAVRDERDRLAGIVSARDLLRLRAGAAIRLDDEIGAAADTAEMAKAWARLPAVALALVEEDLPARTVAAIVSEELRIATRRAGELAEASMHRDGWGAAPCRFALMVLGSGGRGESLLAADQDNALVYDEGGRDGVRDRWFAEYGRRVAADLDATGIPLCTGGVMASNPAWRGSRTAWHARIAEWMRRARREDLMNVDIFFDQRPVAGDLALGHELFERAHEAGRAEPLFARLMAERLFETPSPFGMLGGLQLEGGRIDLKRLATFPLVSAARALAVRHGVARRSTRGRLEGVAALGLGNRDEFAALVEAHALFLSLMLAQQGRDLELGLPVSNRVETASLPRARLAALKDALRAVQLLPEMVKGLM